MTGFASGRGGGAGHAWVWDLRSVNGKGLDLRPRLPDWVEGLEAAVRGALSARIARGSVSLSLRLARDGAAKGPGLNPAGLQAALASLRAADEAARAAGFDLAPLTAGDLLQMKGVLDPTEDGDDTAGLLAALTADLDRLLADFTAARAREGAALARVLAGQIDQISALIDRARAAAEARRPLQEASLKENLARVLAGAAEADPARVAQELALLTLKADVTEELDRLDAHVEAARALMAGGGAIGRKLDFLMQEFMREANTLCSKSGNVELTRIGLDLKTVIDQMREQVQNVE
ncbi:MAG: YicC family protein [Proteobacteria bacterium]|nr:YicC family protein [Pseudomonadota bacterium]